MDVMQARRRLLMMPQDGKLPSEYQAVEWIESSGYAYLQFAITIPASSTLLVDYKAKYKGSLSNNYWIGGSGQNKDDTFLEIGHYGGWYTPNKTTAQYIDDSTATIVKMSKTYNTLQTVDFRICGRSGPFGTGSNGCFETRFFSLIIQIDGQTTNEIVPCYRKTDNVIGAYDMTKNEFLTNKNSVGSFIKGQNA